MYNILCNFAEVTVREIERDTVASENDRSNHEEAFPPNSLNSIEINDRDVKAIHEAVFSINASQIDWPIQYANSAWCNLFQVSFKDVIGTSLWDIFDLASLQGNLDELKARVLSEGAPLRVSLKVHDGISVAESVGDCHAEVEFILASRDQLSGSVPVGIPSYISSDLYDHVGDVSNGSRDAKGNNNDDNNDIACQEEQTDELDTKRSSGDTGYNNLDESTNTMARQDFVSNIMASFWFGVVRFRSSTTKQSTVRSSAEISEKSRLYKSLSLSSSDRSHRYVFVCLFFNSRIPPPFCNSPPPQPPIKIYVYVSIVHPAGMGKQLSIYFCWYVLDSISSWWLSRCFGLSCVTGTTQGPPRLGISSLVS